LYSQPCLQQPLRGEVQIGCCGEASVVEIAPKLTQTKLINNQLGYVRVYALGCFNLESCYKCTLRYLYVQMCLVVVTSTHARLRPNVFWWSSQAHKYLYVQMYLVVNTRTHL
jgi:hypothetical protein